MRIAQEIQPLCGLRLDKFVDYGKSYRLRIGKTDIGIDAPARMNITKYIRDSPAAPTDFAFAVRKRIDNARLVSVSLHEADRVVVFEFEKEGEVFRLVFEMFSSGNCVLLAGDSTCLVASEYNEWKDREIRQKKPYLFPKSDFTRERMLDVNAAISGKFVSSCLSKLPIGTIYTNEALARSGIGEKIKGTELSESQVEKIGKELAGIVESQKPLLYFDGGKPVEFALTPLAAMEGKEAREMPTLSECVDEYCNANTPARETEKQIQETKEIARIREMEARQEEHMRMLDAAAISSGAAGKAILENMELVDAAIEYAKKGKATDSEKNAILNALEKAGKLGIDRKKGTLEIELGAD
ncbi:MAG TPA: NFACT family protein [Candidatus Micrarchaeota archaeon]|nr:NFACT family protein [Candidatus Micrarchaeota archaeon]